MDLIGGIFILAVASAILTSICVGFVICAVIFFWRRDERKAKETAKIDAEAESGRKSIPQGNEIQKGITFTVEQAVGFAVVFVGFSTFVTRVGELNITLIAHIGYSFFIILLGFLIMSWSRWRRKKAK